MTGPRHGRINGNGGEARPGKYADLIAAIVAMKVGDPPLRWDLPRDKLYSLRTMLSLQAVEHKRWIHWHNGQVWIVRYE